MRGKILVYCQVCGWLGKRLPTKLHLARPRCLAPIKRRLLRGTRGAAERLAEA